MTYIVLFLESFRDIFISMSAYIMLGLFFVGVLHTYVKREKILKHLGSEKFSSVVKASMVGVPLPLCSCGVVPTAVELKKDGASNGAVISFLISTPQTGVDSIMATYSMMGPVMAVFRPLAAFASGIIGGGLVNLLAKEEKIAVDTPIASCCCSGEGEAVPEVSSCGCGSEPEVSSCGCGSEPVVSSCGCSSEPEVSSCGCGSEPVSSCGCSSEPVSSCGCSSEPVSSCGCSGSSGGKPSFVAALRYAFCEFLDEISVHFLTGMVLASLISAFLPADFFVNMGINQGIFAMLSMVLVGLPMYICSTASIPIALSLMTKGLSLGGAFVFLFTGPVTNIASLLVLRKVLGKKITNLYFAMVVLCSIGFGLILDNILTLSPEMTALCDSHSVHGGHVSPVTMVIAVVFAGLLLASYYRNFRNRSPKASS